LEIQDGEPEYNIPINRVGFKNLWKRVMIESPYGTLPIDLEINVYIDLPSNRKGAHLSRNVEAIGEEIKFPTSAKSIEAYLGKIHNSLLKLHPYAKNARVEASTRYGVNIEYGDLSGIEPAYVSISVEGCKEKRWTVSVGIYGMTACPSAQGTISSMMNIKELAPSHSQKVLLFGTIEIPGSNVIIRIEDIAQCLSKAFSAPAFTLLKRYDEGKLVIGAHRNPKFVEDVVRDAIRSLRCLAEGLPGETTIKAEAISFESIHPHNVYAYAEGRLSELPKKGCEEICSELPHP